MRAIFYTVLSILSISPLFGISVSEAEVVVELTAGSGDLQIGLTEEGVAVGPCRLVAGESSFYLLDQLNDRVVVCDTSGNLIRHIPTPFRAADMAVDTGGRVWLLENRSQPAEIAIMDEKDVVAELSIQYDVKEPVTAIVVHPPDSLLVFSGNTVYLASFDGHGIESNRRVKVNLRELDLDSLGALEVSGARNMGVQTGYSGRITEYLLAYGSGLLWIGEEQYIQDKSGSFTMCCVKILSESTAPPPWVSIPSSYYCYDVGWRNVSVDPRGNVYVLVTEKEGTARILRWRLLF